MCTEQLSKTSISVSILRLKHTHIVLSSGLWHLKLGFLRLIDTEDRLMVAREEWGWPGGEKRKRDGEVQIGSYNLVP